MHYDKELKKRIESLANRYYEEKDLLSERERHRLEEKVVAATEEYVFSVLQNRPYHCMDDIRQAARIGIVKAIRKYDPGKGAFCTWVLWQTRDTVNRDKNSHWIKIPAYVKDNLAKLRKYLEDHPNDDERILEYFGWSPSMLARVRDADILSNSNLEYASEASADMMDTDMLDTSIVLRKELDNLAEEERLLVNLVIVENRSLFEVSSITGLQSSIIQEKVDNALLKLREALQPEDFHF